MTQQRTDDATAEVVAKDNPASGLLAPGERVRIDPPTIRGEHARFGVVVSATKWTLGVLLDDEKQAMLFGRSVVKRAVAGDA